MRAEKAYEFEVMIKNPENIQEVADSSGLWTEAEIKKMCESAIGYSVAEKACYCIHDKDKYVKDSEKHKKGENKAIHVHVMFFLNKSMTPLQLAEALEKVAGRNVDVNRIEKMRNGGHMSVDSKYAIAVAYLIHAYKKGAGRPDFPQNYKGEPWDGYTWLYKEDEPKCYGTTFERELETAQKAIENEIAKGNGESVIKAVYAGEIREFEIFEKCSPEAYRKICRELPNAFEYAYGVKAGNPEKKNCVFITGKAGSGKTTLAKKICEAENLSYYIASAGKNPLDGYKGQDCIIFDDLRDNIYQPTELLKILDNDTACEAPARYHDKNLSFCKMIIITAVKPLENWYKNAFAKENEDSRQLYRRIETKIEIGKRMIEVYGYNKQSGKYDLKESYENIFSASKAPAKGYKAIVKALAKVKKFVRRMTKAEADQERLNNKEKPKTYIPIPEIKVEGYTYPEYGQLNSEEWKKLMKETFPDFQQLSFE